MRSTLLVMVLVLLVAGFGCRQKEVRYTPLQPAGPVSPYGYPPYAYGYAPAPYPPQAVAPQPAVPGAPAYAVPYGPAPVSGYVQANCGKCRQPVLAGPTPGLSCPYCGTINYYR